MKKIVLSEDGDENIYIQKSFQLVFSNKISFAREPVFSFLQCWLDFNEQEHHLGAFLCAYVINTGVIPVYQQFSTDNPIRF
jgi:hypothetical protein